MISRIVRSIGRFLGASAPATGLLVVVVLYSAVATFIPQGGLDDPVVSAWVASYPTLGTLTRFLGMHAAFASLPFRVCASLLAVSLVLCSRNRTSIAIHRARMLRAAAGVGAESLAEDSDVRVSIESNMGPGAALTSVAEELENLGIKTRRQDGMLFSLSPPWSVWGSPLFHWALVGFMVTTMVAGFVRSEGLIGLAVGEVKPNSPSSYGFLNSGQLHRWDSEPRGLRLEKFEPEFAVGDLDVGPTPTVSLLDPAGTVIKAQRVYPNKPLKSGSLTVHADDYGLAVRIAILDGVGVEAESGVLYVDFDTGDPAGTRSLGSVILRDSNGVAEAKVQVTVPLDRDKGQLNYWMPAEPSARLLVTSPDGRIVEDRTVAPGQDLALETGQTLRVDGVDWYYRLSVVDDPMIPAIYALLVVAFIGLTVTLLARQRLLVAATVDTPEGPALAMKVRFWRNMPCERAEFVERLNARLGSNGGAPTHDA